MNAAGWLVLAWDAAIVVFAAWAWRHREQVGPTPGWFERGCRAVLLAMALAATIMVPIVAKPGDQPHESRINSMLTQPALMLSFIGLAAPLFAGSRPRSDRPSRNDDAGGSTPDTPAERPRENTGASSGT